MEILLIYIGGIISMALFTIASKKGFEETDQQLNTILVLLNIFAWFIWLPILILAYKEE